MSSLCDLVIIIIIIQYSKIKTFSPTAEISTWRMHDIRKHKYSVGRLSIRQVDISAVCLCLGILYDNYNNYRVEETRHVFMISVY